MKKHFKRQLKAILHVYETLERNQGNNLVAECLKVIKRGNTIIAGGLGKNVPICEKFIGTLNSLGIDAHFLHINSAIHGDLGLIKKGDLVILLSKSGNTEETVHLAKFLIERKTKNWLLTCNPNSSLRTLIENSVVLDLKEEGDPWNLVPNNSSVVFLIYLQAVAMAILESLPVKLETFKQNHPGGAIGRKLYGEVI